jgi:hypothetical protein
MSRRKAVKKDDPSQGALFDRDKATSHKAQVEFVSTKKQDLKYGGIGMVELTEKLKGFAEEFGGSYTPSEWNGSATIVFNSNDIARVQSFIERLNGMCEIYMFRVVMTLHIFADDVFGVRYQVHTKTPGILVVEPS